MVKSCAILAKKWHWYHRDQGSKPVQSWNSGLHLITAWVALTDTDDHIKLHASFNAGSPLSTDFPKYNMVKMELVDTY